MSRVITAAVAAGLVLTGCGGGTSQPPRQTSATPSAATSAPTGTTSSGSDKGPMLAPLTGSVYPHPFQGPSYWAPDDTPDAVFEASFSKPVTVELLCRTGNRPGQASTETMVGTSYFVKLRYPGGIGYAKPSYVGGIDLDLRTLPEC